MAGPAHFYFYAATSADVQGFLPMLDVTRQPIRCLHEPLFYFAILAALLFLVDYLTTQEQKDRIVVSKETAEFLVVQRELLVLRALSPEERRQTLKEYINNEILYSEAYKRGLDRGDSRMRRDLIRKTRELLGGEIGDPTERELRVFYESNREQFLYDETWSVEQIYFSDAAAIPGQLLSQLQDSLDPLTVGENRLDFRRNLPDVTRSDLVRLFGPASARKISGINDDQWQGPLESPFGFHFVRLTGHVPAFEPPFEDIEPYLEGDWRMSRTQERVEQAIKELRKNYEIVIENPDPGS
jgi:hypothetical protein